MKQTTTFVAQGSPIRERELLNQIAGGSEDAMAQLYTEYFPRLFRFIFRIVRDYDRTEEVVNDVMTVVWHKAEEFRGDSKVSTWILGIAYRQSLRLLGRNRLDAEPSANTKEPSVDDRLTFESNQLVAMALQRLPLEQRMVMELVFYLGLSYREVASVVNCPVNTVKTRVFHARRKLKQIMIEIQ